jgi:hypothetical protein
LLASLGVSIAPLLRLGDEMEDTFDRRELAMRHDDLGRRLDR